ncbi:MAG: adenosylmethionine--8-amino-7-oxononanoate transaminase [Sporocytophaga sp.]|nr:adenosylmethionine--8-amino-7-oxononanoate transaminase [Sporocytophaga sp.]
MKSTEHSNYTGPIWYPYSAVTSGGDYIKVDSAKGVYLYTSDGRKILDAVSSWWVNLHGHCNEYIAQKIYEQALKLEHVIFSGFTHDPAIRLAERLLDILPSNQKKMFYSDNGSTAVEVAIKMSLQYWHCKGEAKKKAVAIKGAFHGDTFGAMSVSGRGVFNQEFSEWMFETVYIDFPSEEKEIDCLEQFEAIVKEGDVACFIYEPLLQGAAGMRTYSPFVLEQFLKIAGDYDVICIADEVMTGFGRTGRYFASLNLKTYPDIMCLSKGITGGTMALGATTCSLRIADTIKNNVFYHGHSFTANPLACAAANASLDIFLNDECQSNIVRITHAHEAFIPVLRTFPFISRISHVGTVLSFAIDFGEEEGYLHSKRNQLYDFFLKRNILLRPLGNVLYIIPPYIITNEELGEVYRAISDLLEYFSTGRNI